MRILFTKRAFSPIGGSESLTYQFATRLAERGHDVRVVCGQAFDDRPHFVERGVEVVQVKPRGKFLGIVGEVADLLFDLMRLDELERWAEDRELIHNVGREYLDSSLAVAQTMDIPIVLTPLDVWCTTSPVLKQVILRLPVLISARPTTTPSSKVIRPRSVLSHSVR